MRTVLSLVAAASRCLITTSVVLGLYVGGRWVWDVARPVCTQALHDMAPSPDGAWLAVLSQESCRAYFVSAHVTTTVELSPIHEPSRVTIVLRGATEGRTAPAPGLAWPEPRSLAITAGPALALLAPSVDDVRVSLQPPLTIAP